MSFYHVYKGGIVNHCKPVKKPSNLQQNPLNIKYTVGLLVLIPSFSWMNYLDRDTPKTEVLKKQY